MEKCMQQAKMLDSLEWDSFLEVNIPGKKQGNVHKDQLENDVKDAFGKIFKTESLEMKK